MINSTFCFHAKCFFRTVIFVQKYLCTNRLHLVSSILLNLVSKTQWCWKLRANPFAPTWQPLCKPNLSNATCKQTSQELPSPHGLRRTLPPPCLHPHSDEQRHVSNTWPHIEVWSLLPCDLNALRWLPHQNTKNNQFQSFAEKQKLQDWPYQREDVIKNNHINCFSTQGLSISRQGSHLFSSKLGSWVGLAGGLCSSICWRSHWLLGDQCSARSVSLLNWIYLEWWSLRPRVWIKIWPKPSVSINRGHVCGS